MEPNKKLFIVYIILFSKYSIVVPVQNDGPYSKNNNNLQEMYPPEYENKILPFNNAVPDRSHVDSQHQQLQYPLQYPFPQPKRRHYKITLIRPPPQPIQQPLQPEIEEQTIVYVLVKKSEEPKIEIEQTEPAFKLSKPEVYFIKYQTKSEKDTLSYPATTSNVPSE